MFRQTNVSRGAVEPKPSAILSYSIYWLVNRESALLDDDDPVYTRQYDPVCAMDKSWFIFL